MAPKGRVRRERSYKTISVDHHPVRAKIEPGKFEIENRGSKDRINNIDGTYTVLQFTGNSYSAAQYTAHGGRIQLKTYNDEGTALKELGATSRSITPSKLNRPHIPGKVKKQYLVLKALENDRVIDATPEEDSNPSRAKSRQSLRSLRHSYY